MCSVSMVMDTYRREWDRRVWEPMPAGYPVPWPSINPLPMPHAGSGNGMTLVVGGPTQAQFDALKAEVEMLKKLLIAAKKYDEDNGEKDCELESKIAIVRKVADAVGVSMEDVFGK